ncbi:Protoporphyrinogen oxidase (fragment) [Burkholderiales bacterium 8X]
MIHLIVFSHLRWDFVYQRPQHLLSRLASHFEVVVLEEPIPHAKEDRLERIDPAPNVRVLRPHLTGEAHGFHDEHIPKLRQLLEAYVAEEAIEDYWTWYYTPMALPLAAGLDPLGTVYDCMDELSAFRHAPKQLLQRESALLKEADLVFTGGASLYEAKCGRHPDVHCFPSSVDAAHFSRAGRPLPANDEEHPAQAHVGRPRLGFFGVIDERIDLDLIAAIADARPEWQLIMVGPVVKIDPASLPQRQNIQWLGQRSYAELPDLVAGWDVCLLPFALNESTRFISPTKTLEYLAADRPAVSTPIHDVVRGYTGVVSIAGDHQGFIDACQAALDQSPEERARSSMARAEVVAATSWDRTAASMTALMRDAQARRSGRLLPGGLGYPEPLVHAARTLQA